jgi:hypothetical protein
MDLSSDTSESGTTRTAQFFLSCYVKPCTTSARHSRPVYPSGSRQFVFAQQKQTLGSTTLCRRPALVLCCEPVRHLQAALLKLKAKRASERKGWKRSQSSAGPHTGIASVRPDRRGSEIPSGRRAAFLEGPGSGFHCPCPKLVLFWFGAQPGRGSDGWQQLGASWSTYPYRACMHNCCRLVASGFDFSCHAAGVVVRWSANPSLIFAVAWRQGCTGPASRHWAPRKTCHILCSVTALLFLLLLLLLYPVSDTPPE